MATKNGLEQAMILLINNQAKFVSQLTEANEKFAQTDERFARIERELAGIREILSHHETILLRHEQILENLPEAIRQKIGFESRRR